MDDLTQPLYLGEAFNVTRGRRRHRRPLSRWDLAARVLAASVILCGAVLVCWALYQPYAHQGAVRDSQASLGAAWNDPTLVDPNQPTPKPKKKKGNAGPGFTPVAKLTIPSLGLTWYVIGGVDEGDLKIAPGVYPQSVKPGASGNFAIAGHREAGMFWDLDRVGRGQQIIVETHTARYTYTVSVNKVTAPDAWGEVSKTPPGFSKGDHVLTLTTCNPKWDNYQRLIVHALLTNTQKV
jgi:sortase A